MPRPLDPDGLRYARYWEPVLAGPARRALARIDGTPEVFLDVGAGTGGLALVAAERWEDARVIALDATAAMLAVGRRRVAQERPADAGRFEWLTADALAMPLADGSVDVAASSFVLQLVDDRRALLREVRRVLRPGGVVTLVTWLSAELAAPADGTFDELVVELGLAPPLDTSQSPTTTDYRTPDELLAELAAVGFGDIDVRVDELRHGWTRLAYLDFKVHYHERDLFESLSSGARERLLAALVPRWAELPDSAFVVQGPLVCATARRPWA